MDFFTEFNSKIDRTKFIVWFILSLIVFIVCDNIWQSTVVTHLASTLQADEDIPLDIYIIAWILNPLFFYIQMMLQISRFNDIGSDKRLVYVAFVANLFTTFLTTIKPEVLLDPSIMFIITIFALAAVQVYVIAVCALKKGLSSSEKAV